VTHFSRIWSSTTLIAVAITAFAIFGQTTGSPRFEVASIKPAQIALGQRIFLGMRYDPGRFTPSNVTLPDLAGKPTALI